MKIRKMQGVIISSFCVIGLVGCSNSSSWRQGDDSPWKSKRDTEITSTSSEEFVEIGLDDAVEQNAADEIYTDPELMLDLESLEPEVLAEPELESISDFENLEVEAAEPVVATVANNIMDVSSTAYAVQVYAGRVQANVKRYQSSHRLDDMLIVKTNRDGDILYVLVGVYNDRAAAMQAVKDIEQSTGSKPWMRSVAGLQSMFVE